MTDQELARERAARELARLLRPVTNLKDPEAAAATYIDWLQANHWRYMPPPPGITPVTPNPDAYERGAPLARQAISCGARCWNCRFGDCYDPPRPHTWIDDEPLPADAVTEHPCACPCSKETSRDA